MITPSRIVFDPVGRRLPQRRRALSGDRPIASHGPLPLRGVPEKLGRGSHPAAAFPPSALCGAKVTPVHPDVHVWPVSAASWTKHLQDGLPRLAQSPTEP